MSALPAMDLTVGAIVVSSFFSFLTMGIVCVTGAQYFANYKKDALPFKLLVAINLAMCIFGTVVDGIWCYDWTVAGYGNPAVMAILPLSAIIEIFLVGTTCLLVQTFYAWRIWTISMKRNVILPGFIIVMSLTQWIVILWVVSYWSQHRLMTELGGVVPVAFIWLGTSIAADVCITASMVWYLRLKSNVSGGFSSVTLGGIVSRTIQANVLSLISQVMTFVLYKANLGLWFFLIDFTIVKVYTFSLLWSLNSRRSSRATDNSPSYVSSGSIALEPVSRGTRQNTTKSNVMAVHVQRDVDFDNNTDLWTTSKSDYKGSSGGDAQNAAAV